MTATAERPTLYAAQIICPCGLRLGIVETSMVNNNLCACGRQFQMTFATPETPASRMARTR